MPIRDANIPRPATARHLPMRHQSVSELHSYFGLARDALNMLPGGFDVKTRGNCYGKAELFANRLIRAQAVTVDEILMKIEAAKWIGQNSQQTLSAIRDDLYRLKAIR